MPPSALSGRVRESMPQNCGGAETVDMVASQEGRLVPKLMSFDVFGTLIDVRAGSYAAFQSILADANAAACRRQGVLGALGGAQHRALLGAVSALPRHLRVVSGGNAGAFRHQGTLAADRALFRSVSGFRPVSGCDPDARPACCALSPGRGLQHRRRPLCSHAAEARLRSRLHGRAGEGLQAGRRAVPLSHRQRRLRAGGHPALRASRSTPTWSAASRLA